MDRRTLPCRHRMVLILCWGLSAAARCSVSVLGHTPGEILGLLERLAQVPDPGGPPECGTLCSSCSRRPCARPWRGDILAGGWIADASIPSLLQRCRADVTFTDDASQLRTGSALRSVVS